MLATRRMFLERSDSSRLALRTMRSFNEDLPGTPRSGEATHGHFQRGVDGQYVAGGRLSRRLANLPSTIYIDGCELEP